MLNPEPGLSSPVRLGRGWLLSSPWFWSLLAVGIIGGLLNLPARRFFLPSPPAVSSIFDEDPEDPLVHPTGNNPGYLGPQACAACHAERAE